VVVFFCIHSLVPSESIRFEWPNKGHAFCPAEEDIFSRSSSLVRRIFRQLLSILHILQKISVIIQYPESGQEQETCEVER